MNNEKTTKSKLFRSKKGFNDIMIIGVLMTLLLGSSFVITNLNAEFNSQIDEFDTAGVLQDGRDVVSSPQNISLFDVVVVLMKLALFDWSGSLNLPLWMELLYSIMTISLILVLARNVWIGGGA